MEDVYKYINEPEIEPYTTYLHEEKRYIMSKYRDTYLWSIYEYYLENKGLPEFFKSNKTVLKELYNCMAEPKFIECKKILMNENILEEIKDEKGKVKHYVFHRLKIKQEVINHNPENNPNEPQRNDKYTTNQKLVLPQRNDKYLDSSKSLENQAINPDFDDANINNINNNNKVCANINNISSTKYRKQEKAHTQDQYIKDLKQPSNNNSNNHDLVDKIKTFFKQHAEYRLQDLTILEDPSRFTWNNEFITNINKKLTTTGNTFDGFIKWLGETDAKNYVIKAKTINILSSIDSQVNQYISMLIEKKKEEKKHTSGKPIRILTPKEIMEL
jgi:hypothetical protein